MSVIKKYLPNVVDVIESIEQSPDLYYMQNIKVDIIMGSEDAMQLTDEFMEAYDEDSRQDFTRITAKYK